MSRSTPLEEHENCSAAATLFEAGADDDGDGVLSDAEVDTSVLSCRNAASDCTVTTDATHIRIDCTGKSEQVITIEPNKLVVTTATPADGTCLNGGLKLQGGLDDGQGAGEPNDGMLHPDEIDATKIFCNPFCGDGNKDALEQCDDGDRDSGDGCDSVCRAEPSCLPPSPDPSCPPAPTYFVDTVQQPPVRSLSAGFDLTLRGLFPLGTVSANGVAGDSGLTLAVASATTGEVHVTIPPGSGSHVFELSVDGSVVPWLKKTFGLDGLLSIAPSPIGYTYSSPEITSVSGCIDQVSPLDMRGCQGGNVITISGQNFGADTAAISVGVGGAACASIGFTVPGSLSCTLPQGKGVNTLSLTADGLVSNAANISYVAPVISSITFDDALPAPTTSRMRLTINGTSFGANPSAEYGRDGHYFPCGAAITSSTQISCELEPGTAGSDLHFIVHDNVDDTVSLPSSTAFSYIAPSIVAGSLRTALGAPTGDTLSLSSVGGSSVFFDVQNAGDREGLVSVSVGGANCPVLDLHGSGTDDTNTIECVAPPGQGTPTFSLTAFGQTVTSVNTLSYSFVPSITSIVGEGMSFPREGGVTLTVQGAGFVQGTTSVFVDDAQCPITYLDPSPIASSIHCVMPPGKGSAIVRVFSNGVPSTPHTLMYALPSITQVAGCQDAGASTIHCPNDGGTNIKLTISGANFGASEALVFVGQNECTGVVHDSSAPNRSLTCTLPPGAGSNQSVRIINDGASPPFYLSYQE